MRVLRLLKTSDAESLWTSPWGMNHFENTFRDFGVEIIGMNETNTETSSSGKFDLILTDIHEIKEIERAIPTVVYDGKDYPLTVGRLRYSIQNPAIKTVVKSLAFSPLHLDNSPIYENSILSSWIWEKADPAHRPHTINPSASDVGIPLEHLKKIRTITQIPWSFHYRHFDQRPPSIHTRPIDVLFVGSQNSYWPWHLRYHRSQAVEAIRQLPRDVVTCLGVSLDPGEPRRHFDREFPNAYEHALLMQHSKIVVSPYGYGEVTIRDYEASFFNCITIKPPTAHIRAEPDPFRIDSPRDNPQNHAGVYRCEPDFSDLGSIVHNILSNYKPPEESYNMAFSEMRKNPETLATRWIKIFKEALA